MKTSFRRTVPNICSFGLFCTSFEREIFVDYLSAIIIITNEELIHVVRLKQFCKIENVLIFRNFFYDHVGGQLFRNFQRLLL
jgi:hypothetical protein